MPWTSVTWSAVATASNPSVSGPTKKIIIKKRGRGQDQSQDQSQFQGLITRWKDNIDRGSASRFESEGWVIVCFFETREVTLEGVA